MTDVLTPVTPDQRAALLRDLIAADSDWTALANRHGLMPDDLAAWIAKAENHRTLSALCRLADLQTQVLLSRCRLLAASRLLSLAGDQDGATPPEVARKACVDLLKMDLSRADPIDPTNEPDLDAPGDELDAAWRKLRDALRADTDDADDPIEDEA